MKIYLKKLGKKKNFIQKLNVFLKKKKFIYVPDHLPQNQMLPL
jgi:hypothetical protein